MTSIIIILWDIEEFTFLIIGETYDPWAESTTGSDDSGGKLQISFSYFM